MKKESRIKNFRDRKVTIDKAISILRKNGVHVDEVEATGILDLLYHIAVTYNKWELQEKLSDKK